MSEDEFIKLVCSLPVEDSGCVIWPTRLDRRNEYGWVRLGSQKLNSHRASYAVFYGCGIPSGFDVMHSCDVRACVEPDHLSLGTRKQNLEDMTNKRRGIYGEDRACSKLTEAQVRLIKTMLGSMSQKEIAATFDVSQSTISKINLGLSWGWL